MHWHNSVRLDELESIVRETDVLVGHHHKKQPASGWLQASEIDPGREIDRGSLLIQRAHRTQWRNSVWIHSS